MRRKPSRHALGIVTLLAGCVMVAVTALVGWGSPASASGGQVFLVIRITDSAQGQFPTGSPVTVTANLTNSSTGVAPGTATPTVILSYSTGALSFLTNGAGWTCPSAGAGSATCSDETLTPGASEALPLVFSVIGNPGDPASVTATVSDGADLNSATFTPSLVTATDFASVANPGSYTSGAPAGGFPQEVGADRVITADSLDQTYTFTDAGTTIAVHVPPNALPNDTHVGVYRANRSLWSGSASSSSQTFVDGYGVGWTASGASTGIPASSSLTLTVSDSAASSGDSLYRAVTSGIGPPAGTARNGSWVASFTDDPGFVLLRRATTSSTTTSSTTTGRPPPPRPDLIVSSLGVSRAPRGKLSLRATTRNAGRKRAGPSVTAFYLWSVKGLHARHHLASRAVGALGSGQSATEQAKVGVPRGLAPGAYRVLACADATHKVTESSEANNCRLSATIVTVHKPKKHGGAGYVSLSSSPLPPQELVVSAPRFAGAPGRMTPVFLLLGGVLSLIAGIALIGLRKRALPAALA